MNELRKVAALQARVYEFLENQDEATLQAILDGTVRLGVLGADEARLPAASERPRDLRTLTVTELRTQAKILGLSGYSRLKKTDLVDLISHHGRVDGNSPGPKLTAQKEAPVAAAPPAPPPPAPQNVEAAAIATRLRETETVEEGAAYLEALHLDRDGLLAVATELGLSRVDRLRPSELEKRVLKQAIGARRKFAGLRKW